MATRRRRRFTADFKKRVALEAFRGDRTVQEIAARHVVYPNQVSTWKRQAIDGLDEVFGSCKASFQSEHETTIRDLHAKIGELTVERDFFCEGSNAEPGRTPADGRARQRVEHQPSVRVARHLPPADVRLDTLVGPPAAELVHRCTDSFPESRPPGSGSFRVCGEAFMESTRATMEAGPSPRARGVSEWRPWNGAYQRFWLLLSG